MSVGIPTHLHGLVADGLFLERVYFIVIPKVNLRPLAEFYRVLVLKNEGLYITKFGSNIYETILLPTKCRVHGTLSIPVYWVI